MYAVAEKFAPDPTMIPSVPNCQGARAETPAPSDAITATPTRRPVAGLSGDPSPTSDERGDQRRDEEPKREHAGDHAAFPAELIEDRRKQERERRAGVDADRHGDEGRRDDDPAVEDRRCARRDRAGSGCGGSLVELASGSGRAGALMRCRSLGRRLRGGLVAPHHLGDGGELRHRVFRLAARLIGAPVIVAAIRLR